MTVVFAVNCGKYFIFAKTKFSFMKLWILIFSLVFLGSCAQKIVPEKPIPGQFGEAPKGQESAFEIPISIPLAVLNQFIEKQIPSKLYAGKSKGTQTMSVDLLVGTVNKDYNWEVDYTVYKSNKISLNIDDDGTLLFKIPLKITTVGCASVLLGTEIRKCGNASPEIDLLIKTKIHANADWMFSSKTTIAYDLHTAVLNIPFQLGNFPLFTLKLDIKKDLQNPINQQLNTIANEIDKQIAIYLRDFDLRSKAQTIWSSATTSTKISDNPPLFVQIQPTRIMISDLYKNKNNLEVKIGINGLLAINAMDVKPVATALPALDKFVSNAGFKVNLPVHIDYGSLSKILMDNFADTTFAGSGYKFTAKAIKMYGAGKNLIVEINYEVKVIGVFKKIVGVMYFKSVPAYNIETNTFYFESCNLTTETNSALTDKSLNKFANKTLTKAIIKLTTYNLKKDIDKYQGEINAKIKNLEMESFNIEGRLDKISFVGFYIEPENLNLYLQASGSLKTTLKLPASSPKN